MVSGSMRVPSAVLKQPLKSALHTSLEDPASTSGSVEGRLYGRLLRATVRPLRWRIAPMVLSAGRARLAWSRAKRGRVFGAPPLGGRARGGITTTSMVLGNP